MTGLSRRRRRDPAPWTWEPAALLTATAVGVTLWVWVAADLIVDALTGSDVHDPINFRHLADTLASPARLAIAVTLTGVVVVGTVVAARSHRWARVTGRARTGFATAGQVEATLGVPRLQSSATQIRPDLYPSQPHRRDVGRQSDGGGE